MMLLERDDLLADLAAMLDGVGAGGGCVALVMGEAGIGKTSLVERLARQVRADVQVLWGACEALFTPRPLGPLRDIAMQTGGALRRLLDAESARPALFSAFLDLLQQAPGRAVVILEDVHWADEATLDLIKFLGRRIHLTETLLVVTYREDEVGASHPLRFVLGDLPGPRVRRLRLQPLSEPSVAHLAGQAGYTRPDLHSVTGGNPFFVTEVLAGEADGVPVSVRDAVLARVARLSPAARRVAELVSVVPARAERWLVEEILHLPEHAVDECIGLGVLQGDADVLAFRHELARMAVEGSLLPVRCRQLHAQVLAALGARAPGSIQVARLVHHASQAGDGAAVLRFAPVAAREAAALNAHREAAAHYASALLHVDRGDREAHAHLLEGRSFECYLTDQTQEALEARRAAVEIRAAQGDAKKHGDNLRWMSRLHWFAGQKAEAEFFAAEAIRVLETIPPGPERAMAYSNRAQLHMLADESDEAVHWGMKAIALAESCGAVETLAHALNNVGSARLMRNDPAGWEPLEKSLHLALEHDLQEHAARAYTNLATCAVRGRDYPRATRYLDEGIAYATERDLDSWRLYITAWRARARFEQGDWTGASEDAQWVLARPSVSVITRIPALAVLGHVRVRRGDPDALTPLDEAHALALETGELQRIAPVVVARAEAAWLQQRREAVAAETEHAYTLAIQRHEPWTLGALAYLRWRAGVEESAPAGAAEPYRLQMEGQWQAAAHAWQHLGCPYEQAMALADGDAEARREALRLFDGLGAEPAAEWLRQQMRSAGIRGIPRGQRPATRAHPAGLTPRQVEVLHLLAEGLTNAGIADRLFISAKTADHHVAAILTKLGVHAREEAAALAREHGWIG